MLESVYLARFFTNGNISVSKHCKPQHVLHGNNNYISIQPIIFIQSLLNPTKNNVLCSTALVEGGMLNFSSSTRLKSFIATT